MFWLNSRGSPVTATSRSRGWHPLYRRYGANLPNSLAWIFADTPWASHPGAPVSVLGTVARIGPNVLFTGTTDQQKGLRPYSSHDPHSNAVHRTSRPDFDPRTTPPYKITFRCSAVSVTDLSPVPFRGP